MIGRRLDDGLQVADVEIEGLHGVEEILGGGFLELELLVNAPSIAGGGEHNHGKQRDERVVFAALAGLNDGGGAADERGVLAHRFVAGVGEIALDIAVDHGAVADGGSLRGDGLRDFFEANDGAGDTQPEV